MAERHRLDNFADAWNRVHIDRYFLNTIAIALGAWLVQIVVATTAGYALSVLRPGACADHHRARADDALRARRRPARPALPDDPRPAALHGRLINSFWAVWLPAGASAFNVIIVKRFFDDLPREIFEAARIDGAGPFRLFWSIVLPMSKPVLGVVSIFAIVASWRDYLWPLLVLPDPDVQPLSVRLPTLEPATELDVFLAALAIATLIPIALFLLFQRLFLRGGG